MDNNCDNPTNFYHKGHQHLSEGRYEKVVESIGEGLKSNQRGGAEILQGELYAKKKLYHEAIGVYRQITTDDLYIKKYKNIRLMYLFLITRKIDSAEYYLKKAKSIQLKDGLYDAYLLENLALIELEKGNYISSANIYKKLERKYLSSKDTLSLCDIYLNLGTIYFEQNRDYNASRYFNKSLEYAKGINNINLLKKCYHSLYILSEATQDIDKALHYYKKYSQYQDSLDEKNSLWELAEIEKEYLEKEKNNKIDHTRSQRNYMIGISAVFLLLSIIIGLLYMKLRRQNKTIYALNQKLDGANRTKNQIFSIISHDLRSSVSALRNKLRKLPDESENIQSIKSLTSATHRMMDNLLNWSLEESESLTLYKEYHTLYHIAEQVLYDFLPQAEVKNITISNRLPRDIRVWVDLDTLKIALRNIIDNAVKFTPKDGKIYIYGEYIKKDDSVDLSIEDTGIGMDNIEDRDRLKMTKGSGLGMELIRSMVEKNGGKLTINSIINKGTCITINLPCKKSVNL